MVKKLEKNSVHNDLDIDGDGVVSDAELAASAALSQHEKMDAQRRMAWVYPGRLSSHLPGRQDQGVI